MMVVGVANACEVVMRKIKNSCSLEKNQKECQTGNLCPFVHGCKRSGWRRIDRQGGMEGGAMAVGEATAVWSVMRSN